MNKLDDLKKLEAGKRYTLVGMGEFGFPYQVQMVLEEVRVEPYAQYPESILLIYKQRNKRSLRQIRFYGNKGALVWDGWVFPDTEMYRTKEFKDYDSGAALVQRSFRCFDPRYFIVARNSVSSTPIIECFDNPEGLSVVSTFGPAVSTSY